MSEPLVCQNPACLHTDDQHDDQTGICLAAGCRCLFMRVDDWDEDTELEELDFDGDAA